MKPDREAIDAIVEAVQQEWGMGGLGPGTLYGDFAAEVALRAVALSFDAGARAEREECAKVCESLIGSLDISGGHALIATECAEAIRARTTP